jgi:hypothetical protein
MEAFRITFNSVESSAFLHGGAVLPFSSLGSTAAACPVQQQRRTRGAAQPTESRKQQNGSASNGYNINAPAPFPYLPSLTNHPSVPADFDSLPSPALPPYARPKVKQPSTFSSLLHSLPLSSGASISPLKSLHSSPRSKESGL